MSLLFKQFLTRVGEMMSPSFLTKVRASVNYLEVGRGMARNGFSFPHRFDTREEVWDVVIKEVAGEPVLYLEFGVAAGDSIRYWSDALKNPDASLHGFDSFEGLPERGGHWDKGQFDMSGRIPEIDDQRVTFHKGWFNETLPKFLIQRDRRIVLNLDADLYSSTKYVLDQIGSHLKSGDYVYFDDMNHPRHELRALEEFLGNTQTRLEPLAGDRSLTHVFFKVV